MLQDSMPILSQNQFKAKADRLLCLIDAASLRDGTSASVLEITKSTLTLFNPTSSSNTDSHSFFMPDPEDVETFMKDLFPTYNVVLNDHFFNSPLFPSYTLREVATIFGFRESHHGLADKLDLSESEK